MVRKSIFVFLMALAAGCAVERPQERAVAEHVAPALTLPEGYEVFNQDKLRDAIAPAWTVYAVAIELCGERLAIEYLGNGVRMTLRARNAKTPEQRAEFERASRELDEVVKHRGAARIESLDDECVRT